MGGGVRGTSTTATISHRHMMMLIIGRSDEVYRYIPEFLSRLKAVVFRDGEHTQEAFAAAEVVVPDGRIVFLARRIENIDLDLFAVQHHLQANSPPPQKGATPAKEKHKAKGGEKKRAEERWINNGEIVHFPTVRINITIGGGAAVCGF